MYQNRRRQPGLGVMLLLYQLFGVIGIDRLPPVTLGTVGLQVAIFLRLFKLPWYKPSEVCVSAYKVLRKREYLRLLYAAFEHGDDWHLYYNMLSFAMKGQSLERRFGSAKFLYILSIFTVLTNTVLVFLNVLASKYLGEYEDQCAIGFSGVIFALKVLTTYYDPGYTQVMGMPIIVPSRYAVWFELVLIQLLVPNVSFYGHLAGILVGMAYVTGPLKLLMDSFYNFVKNVVSSRPRYPPRREQPDRFSERFNQYVPPGMTEEEQIIWAMEESTRREHNSQPSNYPPYSSSSPQPYDYPPYASSSSPPPPGFIFGENDPSPPPPPGLYPDVDELRNRRTAHFYR